MENNWMKRMKREKMQRPVVEGRCAQGGKRRKGRGKSK